MKITFFRVIQCLILLQFIHTSDSTSTSSEYSSGSDLFWCSFNENEFDINDAVHLDVEVKGNRKMDDGAYLSHDGGNTKLHLVSYGPIYNLCEKGGEQIRKFRIFEDSNSISYVHDYDAGKYIPVSELNGYSLLFANVGKNVDGIPSHYFLLDAVTGDCFTKDGNINTGLLGFKIGFFENYKAKNGDKSAMKFELKGKLLRVFDKNDEEVENVKLTTPELCPYDYSKVVNPGEQVYFTLEDITLKVYNKNRKPLPNATICPNRYLSVKVSRSDLINRMNIRTEDEETSLL